MAQVKVIQSSEVGIHLSIDKVEYGFNKSTNTFKQRKADGKFVTVTPSPYIRAILKNQFEAATQKKKTDDIRAWMNSLDLKTMTLPELRAARKKVFHTHNLPAWLTAHVEGEIVSAILKLERKAYVAPKQPEAPIDPYAGKTAAEIRKMMWG